MNELEIGYALSSEEHGPGDLVAQARRAEETGFRFALISDHFHPWTDRQGQSSFVWAVIGGIAQATERLVIGTGVTCPLLRIHPAIIAQAAATAGDRVNFGRIDVEAHDTKSSSRELDGHRQASVAEPDHRDASLSCA